MANLETLAEKIQNQSTYQVSNERKKGELAASTKDYHFHAVQSMPVVDQVALKGLQAFRSSVQKSKLDPLQQLSAPQAQSTLTTKQKSYAVSHKLESDIPVSKELLTGVKTEARREDLLKELEQTAQKKQVERYATTITKDAMEFGDLNAQIQAKDIQKALKKDVLDDVDEILDKIHLLLHRMTGLVQNRLSDVQKRLEARTSRIEELTAFSNELTKEVGKPGGNGSVSIKDNPRLKEMLPKMREMEFMRSDGKVEKLPLPDGDEEWSAEQVTAARQIVDTQKTSMQNMSKKDELEVQSDSQKYHTYLQMRSAMITKWGEAARTLIRGIAPR